MSRKFSTSDGKLCDPKTADLMKGLGLIVVQVVRKAFGPGVIPVMAATAFRENDDYYFFGYDTPAAARAADERISSFRTEILAANSEKPHTLMVVGIPEKQNTRWLTLATGTFDHDGYHTVLENGKKLAVLLFGFDSVDEVEAAAERVRVRPQFGGKMGLFHLSRPDGGELDMRKLKGANEPN
jgi:hypothetical protein